MFIDIVRKDGKGDSRYEVVKRTVFSGDRENTIMLKLELVNGESRCIQLDKDGSIGVYEVNNDGHTIGTLIHQRNLNEESSSGPDCTCKQDIPKGRESEICDWPRIKDPNCPVHK